MRNIKWLLGVCFSFYVPFSLTLSLSLSLPSILCLTLVFFCFFALNFPSAARLSPCVLWTPHTVLLKGRVIKRPFMQVSLMGLSLCTMLRSKPQELQTDMTTPTQTDTQTYAHIDPINDMVTVRFGARFSNSLGAVKRCWSQETKSPVAGKHFDMPIFYKK